MTKCSFPTIPILVILYIPAMFGDNRTEITNFMRFIKLCRKVIPPLSVRSIEKLVLGR